MKYERVDEDNEVAFNLGASQLQLIGNMLATAATAQLNMDFDRWYRALKVIKHQIIMRLSKDERDDLTKKEDAIIGWLKKYNSIDNDSLDLTPRKKIVSKISVKKLTDLIPPYDIRIKEFLQIKGYLVPDKAARESLFGQEKGEQQKKVEIIDGIDEDNYVDGEDGSDNS